MSEHKLSIDVQGLAASIQHIRKELEAIERIVQQSLLEEAGFRKEQECCHR
jgi:hypothetical protein